MRTPVNAMMRVSDGDGERISGVGSSRLYPRKQRAQHCLHLFLGGCTSADHGLFHQTWRVFGDREATARARQQDYAARMREFQSRLRIVVEIDFLDRRCVGPMLGDHRRQRGIEMDQTQRQRGFGIGFYLAVGNMRHPVALDPDNPPAGGAKAGVEADDDRQANCSNNASGIS